MPLIDQVNACNASNYQFFDSWQNLTVQEKALLVGVYYGNRLIEGHQNDAQADAVERAQKKGKKGR